MVVPTMKRNRNVLSLEVTIINRLEKDETRVSLVKIFNAGTALMSEIKGRNLKLNCSYKLSSFMHV